MAINFPSSPATNDSFISPTGIEYIYDGVKWRLFKSAESVYASASNIGSGILSPTYGGTGVNNGTKTVTLSGNFALTLTQTANTNVTLPITGTLATLSGAETLASKTLSSPVLSGTLTANGSAGTEGQVLTSNATGVYWSSGSGTISTSKAIAMSMIFG